MLYAYQDAVQTNVGPISVGAKMPNAFCSTHIVLSLMITDVR
jgi:hypothetical protein